MLVAGAIHEIPVPARRRFTAEEAMFKLWLSTFEADQRRILARLERQSAPIILADAREFEESFTFDYPLLARHIAQEYREAGTILLDEEPRFRVFVETDRQPRGVDSRFGPPCFQ